LLIPFVFIFINKTMYGKIFVISLINSKYY